MTESELVAFFKKIFPDKGRYVQRWSGDDGALINMQAVKQVAVLDMLIEDIHFDRSYSSYFDIGYKSVSVNLSDLAACGAEPVYLLLGLAAPQGFEENAMQQFYNGFTQCANKWGVEFAGGDFSRSDKLTITVTAIGQLTGDESFWSRAGAKTGDYIYVTGQPGCAALGLDILRGKKESYQDAVSKQLAPDPPLLQSRFLRESGVEVTSCCDVSDGLSTELNHLAEESGLRFEIVFDDIPAPDVEEGVEYALNGGEDYELLFTTPSLLDCTAFYEKTGIAITAIGRVMTGSGVYSSEGELVAIGGYDHCAK